MDAGPGREPQDGERLGSENERPPPAQPRAAGGLLPRGYGFNPLVLAIVFCVYFFAVAAAGFAELVRTDQRLFVPGPYEFVKGQKLADMKFDQMEFSVTTSVYVLAGGATVLQRQTFGGLTPTHDAAQNSWFVTSVQIPNAVTTNTTYNISISYGPPGQEPSTLDIVIGSTELNGTFYLQRPSSIILQARERFDRQFLSVYEQGLGNTSFIGITSVPIRIFYFSDRGIQVELSTAVSDLKYRVAIGMFAVGIVLIIASAIMFIYGFNRITQQRVVIQLYQRAKVGGSSYLQLVSQGAQDVAPGGQLWRKYNRDGVVDFQINRYPPLLYE